MSTAAPGTTMTPRELAEHQVVYWRNCTVQDPAGTPSRELYEHFARFCREGYAHGVTAVPSETMWGRVLTENWECPPRATGTAKRRPLRITHPFPDGLGR